VADHRRIEISTGSGAYPVLVGRGALTGLPALLDECRLGARLRILVDEQIADSHGIKVERAARAAGREVAIKLISGRERDKNLAAVSDVYDWLLEVGTDRADALIAVGGGVVGDLVGFAAATYLRGVRLVQIPTTLLAMVDSSIGGKTGVDHAAGKNLIGAFHHPSAVVAELDFLDTLPQREVAAGWAEVIKMGLITCPELFERFERTPEALLRIEPEAEWAIARSIELKGMVVSADEREADLRMILNYGHTIGHAIEAATGYRRYLHGEAVAIGMTGAAELAVRLGMLDPASARRQVDVLRRFRLPSHYSGVTPDELWGPLRRDKKAVSSRLRWVLATSVGNVEVRDDVPEELVSEVLIELASG
jgi:3-dehydroquinate synthase